MKRFAPIAVAVLGLLLAIAPLVRKAGEARSDDAPPAVTTTATSSFRAMDVIIDTHDDPLAAYQFEFWADDGADVKLVGVEGGEHEAFKEPPHYDPRALALPQPRVIVAAFNTGIDLPRGKQRVARLMIHISGSVAPNFHTTLQVAASVDAKPIANATITLSEGSDTPADDR